MSYSFNATSSDKDSLAVAVRDKLAEVIQSQPLHEADADQAFEAANSLIKLLSEDAARELYCSMSGSIWKNEAGVQSLGLNISVGFKDRAAA